jgi:hypothetical protein
LTNAKRLVLYARIARDRRERETKTAGVIETPAAIAKLKRSKAMRARITDGPAADIFQNITSDCRDTLAEALALLKAAQRISKLATLSEMEREDVCEHLHQAGDALIAIFQTAATAEPAAA